MVFPKRTWGRVNGHSGTVVTPRHAKANGRDGSDGGSGVSNSRLEFAVVRCVRAALLPSTWLPLPLSFGVMPNPKGASWLRTFEGETDYDDDEEEEEEEEEREIEEEEEE
ncbi:hypothetical protein HZH68_016480 [Vespula germanica]|uniref:Uncharacterized protein n=1 Tax=Vespula germanica TaxID=30212 RepID=A0A834MQ40_VESGE|nr:hypothetical protein HZH68_016480 [Vespula germanica]